MPQTHLHRIAGCFQEQGAGEFVETKALKLRDQRAVPVTAELAAPHPSMMLPMERPLYTRVHKSALDSDDVRDAEEACSVTCRPAYPSGGR